tara:strand:+ start:423 stop:626 length:204 start_codon:yes stop_codon:yes gene_type:complete
MKTNTLTASIVLNAKAAKLLDEVREDMAGVLLLPKLSRTHAVDRLCRMYRLGNFKELGALDKTDLED